MSELLNAKIINLLWTGPETINTTNFKEAFKDKSGIYQIYGTHPIYGRNVLLYIGKTNDSFKKRLEKHNLDWIIYEYDEVQFYTGVIVDKDGEPNYDSELVDIAERLLIYFSAPAYNSQGLIEVKKGEEVILLNFGKIGSIPCEVSTLWYNSKVWDIFTKKGIKK